MIKKDHIRKRFDEVFDLQMGKTPDRKTLSFFGGDNVWLSIKDMGDKFLSDSNEHITDEAVLSSGIKKVKKGTVVMSFKLTVGKCGIASVDLFTNEAIMAFNVKDGFDIRNDFLYYYLQGYKWEGANKAVMGLTLNKATISKQIIDLPPLAEQEAIVAELDEINETIAELQQQIADLDTLAQSTFYDMFGDPITNPKGWEVKKLGDIGMVITGSTPSTKDKKNYEADDYCFIKPSDINKERVSYLNNSEYHISNYAYNNSRKLPAGSVLTTCIGIVGKVAILNVDATCNQQINAIIPNNECDSIYLAHGIFLLRKVIESIANAPVVPIINKGQFSNINLPIPPLALQQEFAAKVEAIEEAKAELNAQIAEMQTLLASRMDYYFD